MRRTKPVWNGVSQCDFLAEPCAWWSQSVLSSVFSHEIFSQLSLCCLHSLSHVHACWRSTCSPGSWLGSWHRLLEPLRSSHQPSWARAAGGSSCSLLHLTITNEDKLLPKCSILVYFSCLVKKKKKKRITNDICAGAFVFRKQPRVLAVLLKAENAGSTDSL